MKPQFSSGPWRCVWLLGLVLWASALKLLAADAFPEVAQLPSQLDTPNPLVMLNGTPVTTTRQWLEQRRPELKALFQHYMYGTLPPAPGRLHFAVERVDKTFFGGKATKKEVTITFSPAANAPAIHLLLVTPNQRRRAPAQVVPQSRGVGATQLTQRELNVLWRGFPVFVGLNFYGNHTLVTDTNVALPTGWVPSKSAGAVNNHATDAGRGTQVEVWSLEQAIDRGYAVATIYCGDIEPDTPNSPTGLLAFLAGASTATNDYTTMGAWAWGLSRAVDYLVTDRAIDPKRIAVTGHSRLGKAAVLAAAFDERFALAAPLQAGCGGTAPSRGKTGESAKAINHSFPHWFNAEFKTFNEQPDRLPFDQDCLIALVAPRPFITGAAVEDTWGNPPGVFEMVRAADPVCRLFGERGLDEKQMPGINQLVGDHLAFFIRPGKHSMTKSDWQVFLDYADRMMP